MSEFLINTLNQLPPVIGLLVVVLLIAVIYLWKEMIRLRKERDVVVTQKDQDLKEIAERKDKELKEMTAKVMELQEKTIISNNNLTIATNAQTEVGRVLVESVKEVLSSVRRS